MGKGRGFTLVEMMIVTAIIAVLAAIAIPAVYTYQLKARVSEQSLNAYGIADAVRIYDASFDMLPPDNGGPYPINITPGKALHDWVALNSTDWGSYLYKPDGKVRCMYMYGENGVTGTILSLCDVDGDGTQRNFQMNYDAASATLSAPTIGGGDY